MQNSRRIPTNLFNTRRAVNEVEAARARANGHRMSLLELETDTLESDIPPNATSILWGIYPGYVSSFYSPASLSVLKNPPIKPPAPLTVDGLRTDQLQIEELNIPKDYFIDRVFRDFVKGSVVLEGIERDYDFDLIDLSNKSQRVGTIGEILEDEFLFRPVALPNRTWYFQSSFELENSVESLVRLWSDGQKNIKSLNDLRKEAINANILEGSNFLLGGYSPSLACFTSLFFCCFTMDKSVFAILATLFAICAGIGTKCNTAYSNHLERPVSVLLRLGVVVWIWTLGTSSPADRGVTITTSTTPGTVRLCCSLILLADIIVGDLNQFIRRKWFTIRLKVREYLSETLIICETSSISKSTKQYLLSSSVIGEDLFNQQGNGTRFVIIVDAEGLLFQLEPLTLNDLPDPAICSTPLRSFCTKTFTCDAKKCAKDVNNRTSTA